MLSHPDVVPGKADYSDNQHCRVEQLLPRSRKSIRYGSGKNGDRACAQHSQHDAERDPPATSGNAARGGKHDAGHETGLDNLTEDDD